MNEQKLMKNFDPETSRRFNSIIFVFVLNIIESKWKIFSPLLQCKKFIKAFSHDYNSQSSVKILNQINSIHNPKT